MRGREASIRRRGLAEDEDALTAVVEFLSAFVLFLVIVTAFLALSQLKLGSNVPDVDRLDRMAIQGLERLTDQEGWLVPWDAMGARDLANASADWHLANASNILNSDVLPGLSDGNGRIDAARVAALSNVTEDKLALGLGMPTWTSLNLRITVTESDDPARVGVDIFHDGTDRDLATRSASITRNMRMAEEVVRITFEVHDAGRTPARMVVSEMQIEPDGGAPEWVELSNDEGFAVNLTGFGLARASGGSSLIGDGALAGGARLLCTGNPATQWNPNGSMLLDLGASGVLGKGAMDGLVFDGDTLTLTWTEPGYSATQDVVRIGWNAGWGMTENNSITYNDGGRPSDSSNCSTIGNTPGW